MRRASETSENQIRLSGSTDATGSAEGLQPLSLPDLRWRIGDGSESASKYPWVMSPLFKRLLIALALLALVAASGVFGYMQAMKRAWIRYGEYDIRSEGSLSVGDRAPDLELERLDAAGTTRLSEGWAVHPLILVFGSYT